MKGNEIKQLDIYTQHNQGKKVYIQFNFSSLIRYGSQKSIEESLELLKEEYPDGLFTIKGSSFIISGRDSGISICHNLIDKVYEWID